MHRVGNLVSVERSRLEANNELQHNADMYVKSVLDPFGVRDVRVPDIGGFPTCTFNLPTRKPGPAAVRIETTDGVIDSIPEGAYVWGQAYYASATRAGFNANLARDGSGNLSWVYQQHPRHADILEMHQLVRSVSMGVKLINTAPLLKRGGTLYMTMTATRPDEHSINWMLAGQQEALILDVAKIPDEGITMNWMPLSGSAIGEGSATSEDRAVTTNTHFNDPLVRHTRDTWLYWFVVIDSEHSSEVAEFNPVIETVLNLEAVPWPENEFFFHRESVMGGEEDVARAYVAAGRQETSNAIWNNVGKTPPSNSDLLTPLRSVGDSVVSGLGTVAKGAFRKLLPQITASGSGLMSAFGNALGGIFGGLQSAENRLARRHILAQYAAGIIDGDAAQKAIAVAQKEPRRALEGLGLTSPVPGSGASDFTALVSASQAVSRKYEREPDKDPEEPDHPPPSSRGEHVNSARGTQPSAPWTIV